MRAAWVEVNLSNLDYNIKSIQSKIGPKCKMAGVIKADAYGHGAVKVAGVLRANGVNTFAVATLEEAVKLRNAGFILEEIIVLGLTPDPLIAPIIEHRLSPVVSTYENAEAISKAAAREGIIIKGYVAVDTGMGRIGMCPEDSTIVSTFKMIDKLPNFQIQGVFSHFATADHADKTYAFAQEQRFSVLCKKLANAGFKIPIHVIANSAATMEMVSTHNEMVRPGIILYGLYPSDQVDRRQLDIKPVMSVKANIVELKKVPAGTTVSYGRTFTARRDSIIATIPLGYADGLPRNYSTKGKVIVNGVVAPIAGTINMDMTMIDVTSVPYVRCGDEVTIMGRDGAVEITADYIATQLGTINYEIATSFGLRLPKVYTY